MHESEENLNYNQQSMLFKFLFWQFVADCWFTSYLGAMPAEEPFVSLALGLFTKLFYVFLTYNQFGLFLPIYEKIIKAEYWI